MKSKYISSKIDLMTTKTFIEHLKCTRALCYVGMVDRNHLT